MQLRAFLLTILAVSALACGGSPAGKLMTDTPVLPYQAPDVDEITGIEPPDEEEPAEEAETPEATAPTPAPTPTATPAKATPGAKPPAKAPAKAAPAPAAGTAPAPKK